MNLPSWSPDAGQKQSHETNGYCILRQVIPRDAALMIRGVILNHVLTPEVGESHGAEADPLDPMNTGTAEGRAARFRKLNAFGIHSPLIWHQFHCASSVLGVARHFLGGDDILLKFSSCFLKPAKTGASTPWHQDNALWRDGEVECFNIWLAIDPATRENGCLQFCPGSQHEPIFPHVEYPDSIHGEIPRREVERAKARYGIDHVELEPGDAVCWHSNTFHYSPPNTSAKSRIAMAGVHCRPDLARENPHHQSHLWCLQEGRVLTDYPPRPFTGYAHPQRPAAPYLKAA